MSDKWDEKQIEKAMKFMDNASKIKKGQWESMNDNLNILKEFTSVPSMDILKSLPETIMTTISLKFEDALSPFTNEINQMISTALQPFLDDLGVIVKDLTAFIGEGAEGALIGGVVGSIAALWLPGGVIWMALGALIGSAIQQSLEMPLEEKAAVKMDRFLKWQKEWENFWRSLGWK